MEDMKELSKSRACAAKTLYAVMVEMKKRGGSIPVKDISPFVEANVDLTEWEREPAGKMKYIRWTNNFQFYSIDYVKAGFIQKKNGFWYLTPEGEAVLPKGKEEILILAGKAYHAWQSGKASKSEEDEPPVESQEVSNTISLETLESDAREGIKRYIASKGPYEFQEIVAALLRAMGYYTPFIAPKGKDGGIDIIAYMDPLGAKEPRIKAQVKHMPDSSISSKDIQALVGAMRAGDFGLFVTSGKFTSDAIIAARNSKEFIRILDGEDFIEMWQEYYDKMTDEDKNMLPLKRIAFLGSND